MNIYIKKLLIALAIFIGISALSSSVMATTYDLIAPTDQLVRGQEVKFTINIDTEGQSLSTASIGMTYDTKYLEYVSTTPGNTFTTVSADVIDVGKLILTGTSASPYSGAGAFAYVTFKLIATQAGSTQLCVLFNPVSAPSPIPTSPASIPTSPPGSAPVVPTSLPKTGESEPMTKGIVLASFFFILATGSFFIFKKI
ncbi:MAG: cohesin domain-containing protein [Patescibacteria group bacterium]|jgi:hypothetical protein